ncbi:Lysophospholipase 1 [Maudiozyma exigua]|uniref:Lysophospholipase n=1 Tax=Maudiozyma exigua TaxID=34358 RepID=A0A9P7BBA1_MAUEX|nr:Lysophospholipase 1 [Kazachstania exigua]
MQLQNLAIVAFLSYLASVNAWSPTDSYAPAQGSCNGNTNLVREASGLSTAETEWLAKRESNTKVALKKFLDRATSKFSDNSIVEKIFSSSTPRAGYASCGGGYRGTFIDAGIAAAMDERTVGANEHGLGGLLQGMSYMTGLSGGTMFTSTLLFNNWTSVQDIVDQMNDGDHSIWDISESPLALATATDTTTQKMFGSILSSIREKYEAGFDVTLADVYGLFTGYYLYPSLPGGGATYLWSDVQDMDTFKNGEMPMIIELTSAEKTDETAVSLGSTGFEVTPFEFGSWDPTINAFTDMKYLGTEVSNGVPTNEDQCVTGFDNASFFSGASSNIVNYIYYQGNAMYRSAVTTLKSKFLPSNSTVDRIDVNIIRPNPFKDTQYFEGSDNALVDMEGLYMVDGGFGGQNIPFTPLMRKERNLDVVFASDTTFNTADVWPTGSSLVNTYTRQFMEIGKTDAFPYVPDTETMVNLGINKNPTFFGCDSSNLTDLAYVPPLVVYLPNRAYSFNSNITTWTLTYTKEERLAMIQNGFEIATRNNFTDDPDFLGCVGCAVMRRKQEQLGLEWPSECEQCFQRYCWNGTIAHDSRNASTDSTPDTKNDVLPDANAADVSSIVAAQCIDDNCFSTIHTATSTTVTCHECEENKTAQTASFTTTTVECEECEEAEYATTATNGNHKYTTVTSLSTTTEICEECEEAEAQATASTKANGNHVNTKTVTSLSTTTEICEECEQTQATVANGSNNGVKSSLSIPTMLQVTTGIPTYSAMSVVLNENIGNCIELKGFITVVALAFAAVGIF